MHQYPPHIMECFHAFTAAQRDASLLLDRGGLILAANEAALRMLGLSRDSLSGGNISTQTVEREEKLTAYLQSCSRTNSPVPGVITWRTSSGGQLKTPCHGFRLHISPGTPHTFIVIQVSSPEKSTDKFLALNRTLDELTASRLELLNKSQRLEKEINDRGRAEEELRLAHNRLAAILDSIEAFVYVADMQTHEVLFINKYCRDLLGDIRGKICWQSIQEGQNGPCPFCTNKYLVDDEGKILPPHIWEFQNSRTNHWYHIIDRAIRWVDNRTVRLEIATDITAKKEAEEKISKAKREWELTFDAIDEVVTIHDREMTIIRANLAAGRLFGLAPQALIGRKCYEVFRKTFEPCADCPELRAKADLLPHSNEIYHPDIKRTFSVSSSPILDELGNANMFVHIAKDITEQSLLQEQLRQAQKMEAVGTLAGGIAHDFNNVLSPIIGFTELSLTKIGPNHPISSDLAHVLQAAKRARDLVRQILSFSRQSSGERKPLQIHLIIKEALKLLRSSLPTSIEIRRNITADSGVVLADPTQIHQILMNLCTNAYHAMQATAAGVLAINLSRLTLDQSDSKTSVLGLAPGPYVKLVVSDTGCGMDRMIQDKIFEPYFTTKQKGEGTGLGLAVVHGIVKSYGGHISVYSEPGKGTAFHIYLPALAGEPSLVRSTLHEEIPRGNGERILVVDDEQAIVSMQQKLLEGLGYQVKPFTDCEEAMKEIWTHPGDIDLIVTDMTMPRISGLDLAREVKSLRPDLPVILCTGFSELINEETARQCGIYRFLMKPVLTRDLAGAIRTALDSRPAPG
ncbi:MAG: hypothetical protein BM485_09055 [Desulfobulbaceae bacterium DB1]|nr:MAG: hypothetical protein BM485_09055 [Desulfobulbaceae bacterium DB1]